MSAPIIWVGLPLVVAVITWFLQKRRRLSFSLVFGTCFLLFSLALFVPIASPFKIGPINWEIQTTLQILGRRFTLEPGDHYFLVLIYGFGMFWFFGTTVIGAHRYFIPLGLGMISLSVAALCVQPFLYAALLIEMMVLISIPILVPPGKIVGQGVIRYLIYQTLAVPAILFAGWLTNRVEANPTDSDLLVQTLVFLILGFSLWLATFPFFTWIPKLAEEAEPYQAGFLFSILPVTVSFLLVDFLNAYAWLRDFPTLSNILQVLGVLMVAVGGLWAGFQKDATRLFGFAVIIETGFSLLAISLQTHYGMSIFATSLLPRLLSLALCALSLSILGQNTTLDFSGIKGKLHQMPFASIGLIISLLSLSGLPLLAGFPGRLALFENLVEKSLATTISVFVGNLGLFLGTFRLLSNLLISDKKEWTFNEEWPQIVLLIIAIITLIVIGVFPNLYITHMKNLLMPYQTIIP